jgi:hypothetical protein
MGSKTGKSSETERFISVIRPSILRKKIGIGGEF